MWPVGFRSPQCVVCGRDVRGLEDARKEGKLWFCSQGHFVSYTGPMDAKPKRSKRRKFLKWGLIVLGLWTLIGVVGAIIER
jgi:hypothetical protein